MQKLALSLDFILSLNEMFGLSKKKKRKKEEEMFGMNHIKCQERLKEFQLYVILWKYFHL